MSDSRQQLVKTRKAEAFAGFVAISWPAKRGSVCCNKLAREARQRLLRKGRGAECIRLCGERELTRPFAWTEYM